LWVRIQKDKIIIDRIFLGSIGNDLSILDIGISDTDLGSDIGMEADVGIGTLPISK
jgi:hypothetical protein